MIDAVITYVDSSDKHWQNEYEKYVKRPLEEVVNRYRSYGVLDLQIECIRKFMPFVHRIFVVVSSRTQVPKSLLEMKDVVIVTHSDIIPKTYLPCFNSCVIEMFLCKIKGLSERFLYFNDDVFPINKCKPEDFFIDDKICMNYEFKTYDEENASIFQHNVINSTKIFYKENELSFNAIKPMHSVMPMLKSVCSVVLSENLKTIMLSLTRTRHSKNFNAYLFLNYMFKEHRFKPNMLKYEYIELGDELYNIEKDTQLLCVNDNGYCYDFDIHCQELKKFFECITQGKKYKIKTEKNKSQTIHKKQKTINRENNIDILRYCYENNITNAYEHGFSICLTAYRTEKYIEECLDSVQNQTYFVNNKNYEIILAIDHCYETLEKVKSIMNKYSNFKVIMLNENVGTYVASNTAMSLAKYDWIIRFDTDDIMKPNMVEEIAIHINDCDIIQYKLESFSTDGTPFKPYTDYVKGSIAFKKEIFDIYGGYRDWVCSGDYEMLERLSFLNIKYIDKPLLNYRKHSLSLTKDNKTNGKSILRNQYNSFIKDEKLHPNNYDIKIDCKTSEFVEIEKQTIIVNVTTYPARDMFLYEALSYFKKQTLKPTKTILWLAKDEYDELNLPDSITKCIDDKLIDNVMYTNKNIYCHKRHECFKYFNYAFNLFIDDDIYYPITFIEELVYYSTLYNVPSVYFSKNEEYYNINWKANKFTNGPDIKNRFHGGLSCIPPYIFPLESFNYEEQRDIVCPKCDETWMQAWLLKNNIKVYVLNDWPFKKSPLNLIEDTQKISMWNENKKIETNVIKKVSNMARCIVFLNIEDKAKELWPSFDIVKSCDGRYEEIKKISIK